MILYVRRKLEFIFSPAIAGTESYKPEGVGTVTQEEKEKFQEIKDRLRVLLEKQITNFRFVLSLSLIVCFAVSAFHLVDRRER